MRDLLLPVLWLAAASPARRRGGLRARRGADRRRRRSVPGLGGLVVLLAFAPAAWLAVALGGSLLWLWAAFAVAFMGGRAVVLVSRASGDHWLRAGPLTRAGARRTRPVPAPRLCPCRRCRRSRWAWSSCSGRRRSRIRTRLHLRRAARSPRLGAGAPRGPRSARPPGRGGARLGRLGGAPGERPASGFPQVFEALLPDHDPVGAASIRWFFFLPQAVFCLLLAHGIGRAGARPAAPRRLRRRTVRGAHLGRRARWSCSHRSPTGSTTRG